MARVSPIAGFAKLSGLVMDLKRLVGKVRGSERQRGIRQIEQYLRQVPAQREKERTSFSSAEHILTHPGNTARKEQSHCHSENHTTWEQGNYK